MKLAERRSDNDLCPDDPARRSNQVLATLKDEVAFILAAYRARNNRDGRLVASALVVFASARR